MRKLAGIIITINISLCSYGQIIFGSNYGGADFTPPNGSILAGNFTNIGFFNIPAGNTVFVLPGMELSVNARAITIQGVLNGNGAGYIGGNSTMIPEADGLPGFGPGGGLGGLYGGCSHGDGGAGGGYGGKGGNSGSSFGSGPPFVPGGPVYGSISFPSVNWMGSGGGAGANYCGIDGFGGKGGNGGGSVYLKAAENIFISGIVTVDGENGSVGTSPYSAITSGGGGSGGTIVVYSQNGFVPGTLSARGGNGGGSSVIPFAQGGGGGGGGKIKITVGIGSFPGSTIRVNGGIAGLSFGGSQILPENGSNGTISTIPIYTVLIPNGFNYCAGANNLILPFNTASPFNPGNVFGAYLSDMNGNFANATIVGISNSNMPGIISISIPQNTPSGFGYRLKLISTDPIIESEPSNRFAIYNAPPIITCNNIVVNNAANQCGANVNFPINIINANSLSFSQQPGSFFPVGTTTVTATAFNSCGSTTCTFTVTVKDSTPPFIFCGTNISIPAEPGQCGAKVCFNLPQSFDNCGAPPIISGYTFKVGVGNIRYYQSTALTNYSTARDMARSAGGLLAEIHNSTINSALTNSGAGFAWIAGSDSESEGAWKMNSCSPVMLYNNFCSGEPNGGSGENHLELQSNGCWNDLNQNELRYSIIQINSTRLYQTSGLPSSSIFPVGTTINSFFAVDDAGNTASCSFTVTVVDNQLPQMLCPPPITVNTQPNTCGAVVYYPQPAFNDNCPVPPANLIINGSFESGNYNGWNIGSNSPFCGIWGIGTQGQTLNFNQLFFNFATNQFQPVTVTNFPITFDATHGQKMMAFFQNCPGSIHRLYQDVFVQPAFNNLCFDLKYRNIAVGFTNTQFIAIEIREVGTDNLLQTLFKTIPGAPQSIPWTHFCFDLSPFEGQNIRIQMVNANISDFPLDIYLDNITLTSSPPTLIVQTSGLSSGSTFPVGTTINSFRVTDAGGNITTCSFPVTVIDNQPPLLVCRPPVIFNADPGKCEKSMAPPEPPLFPPMITENCGILPFYFTRSDGLQPHAPFPVGTTLITWTITDINNNTSSCTQSVIVKDVEKPVIFAPDLQLCFEEYELGCNIDLQETITDNCQLLSVSNNAPGCFPVGTTDVLWTAMDIQGNVATAIQKITRNPEILVTICASPTATIYTGVGPQCVNLSATASGGTPGYTYSWSPAAGLSDPTSANTSACPTLTTTYELIVTDTKGCTRILNFTVTVLPMSAAVCSGSGNNIKFNVCHVPPGNTSNPENICVSQSALNAHLTSGTSGHNNCYLGPCGQQLCFSTTAGGPSLTRVNGAAEKGTQSPIVELEREFSAKAYPNPSTSDFSFQVVSSSNEPVLIRILDMNGVVWASSMITPKTNTIRLGGNLSNGTYVAELIQGKSRQVIKLVKMN